jgi:hypothetical protein
VLLDPPRTARRSPRHAEVPVSGKAGLATVETIETIADSIRLAAIRVAVFTL